MKAIKRAVFLVVTALFLLIPALALANDSSPEVKEKFVYVGRVLLEDQKYPLDHYVIETKTDDGISAIGDRALAGINNGLWSINKEISNFTIFAVQQLMTFNLIDLVADQISVMSNKIFNAMSATFLGLFVVIAGGTAAWRHFVNQQTAGAIKALVGVIAILTATTWFYSNTAQNIKWINKLSSDLEGVASSTNVFLTSDNVDSSKPYSQQEGTAVLRNQLFNLMVKKPYLFLNYGSTKESTINKEDPNRIDNLLKLKPYTEDGKSERENIVNKEIDKYNNVHMTTDYSGERFGEIFLTIISTVAISIPVILLSAAKFLVQLFFLGAIIFTGIPLVFSLLPTYAETAMKHFKHIVSLAFYKAGLVLLITVITWLSTIIYESMKVTDGLEGYMLVVFVTVLVMWGLYKYRSHILEVASVGMIHSNHAAERITQTASQTVRNTAGKGLDLTKRVTQGSYKRVMGDNGNGFSPKRQQQEGEKVRPLAAVSGGNENNRSSQRQNTPINQKGVSRSNGFTALNSSEKTGGVVSFSDYRKQGAEGKKEGNRMTDTEGKVNFSEKRRSDYTPSVQNDRKIASVDRSQGTNEPVKAVASAETQTEAERSLLRSQEMEPAARKEVAASQDQQPQSEARNIVSEAAQVQAAPIQQARQIQAQMSPERGTEGRSNTNTFPQQEKAVTSQIKTNKAQSEKRKETLKEPRQAQRMKTK